GPDYYEAVSQKAAPAKKGSILPWILIGVGAITITAAVLFLVVLKTKYDITGEWEYFWKNTGDANWYGYNQPIIFSGNKKSGTLFYLSTYTGTYSVDGKNVTFQFVYGSNDSVTNTGTFVDKDKMSGTWVYDQYTNITGSWEAVRVVTTANTAVPQASAGVPGKTKNK
ncbi:MAG: hypothetical protein JXI33_07025, partial [Candidatus Aminicenantes bacterium]|nr:hypothetical protein [Candidatus Aminicenantes bacterium]